MTRPSNPLSSVSSRAALRATVALTIASSMLVLAIASPANVPDAKAGAFGFLVNSTNDAVDANIGDTICQTATPGECTLRAAFQEANAYPGTNNINFASNLNGLPITLTVAGSDDTSAAGDLDSTGPLFIIGNGLQNTIIRACNDSGGGFACAGIDRIIHNTGPNFLFIEDVTLRRGNTTGGGGAILNSGGGDLQLQDSDIRNNVAGGGFFAGTGAINTSGGNVSITNTTIASNTGAAAGDDSNGGGLYVGGGVVTVTRSTFNNNSVGPVELDRGGAIYAAAGSLSVTNSTFSNNTAPDGGSAIYGGGATVALSFVTIAPSTGAALGGTMTLKNSIVSASSTGDECVGATVTRLGVNVIDDLSCGLGGAITIVADPLLLPLANNGGLTQTRALPAQSPAVDEASECTDTSAQIVGADQRGVERPLDGNLPEGAVCDIGAFEREPNAPLVVDSTADSVDATPGNGRCQSVAGPCTLRAAVQEANAQFGADEIRFSPDLDGLPVTLTIAGSDDAAALGDLDVTESLLIQGNGRLNTVIRGCDDGDGTTNCAGVDRLFDVPNGVTLDVKDATLRRGNTGGAGGAIRFGNGTLYLDRVDFRHNASGGTVLVGGGAISTAGFVGANDVTFANNTATGGAFDDRHGGALFINGGIVQMRRAAFLNNVVSNADIGTGGAIYVHAGYLEVTNATFDGNSAPDGGAAIDIINGATVEVNNVTITASTGVALTGPATVKNTIISGSSQQNCGGLAKVMEGKNIVSDTSCGAAGPTIIHADPLLSALGEHGGYPLSRKPLTGGPAIDAVTDCTKVGGALLIGDVRGLKRFVDGDGVVGALCDVGAHELSKGPFDTDGDGCTDEQESGADRNFGGERNAFDGWDFYDVNGDRAIDLADTLGVLSQFGFLPDTPGYEAALDREDPEPARPWRTSFATGVDVGIDLGDALLNLQSFGHSCAL